MIYCSLIYEYAKDNKLGIYDYKDLLQVCQEIRESEFRMERYRMDKKLLDELTINISAKHSRQGKKLFW